LDILCFSVIAAFLGVYYNQFDDLGSL